jgi:hypothetical protein
MRIRSKKAKQKCLKNFQLAHQRSKLKDGAKEGMDDSWGYTQKTVTQVTPEAPAHPCLLQHYSQ